MSDRISKTPVIVHDDVEVIIEGNCIRFKRKDGKNFLGTKRSEIENVLPLHADVAVEHKGNELYFRPKRANSKTSLAQAGTAKSIAQGSIEGLVTGFKINLKVVGIGYKANVSGDTLVLNVGYSNDVKFPIPEDVKITTPEAGMILIETYNKQRRGQVAAEIHDIRRPDAYKNKGVLILDGRRYVKKEVKK